MNVTASLLMGIYIVFDLLVSELMLVNLVVANKWNVALVESLDKQTYKLNLTSSQGYPEIWWSGATGSVNWFSLWVVC